MVCRQIHLELLLRLGQDLAVVFASKPLRSIPVFRSLLHASQHAFQLKHVCPLDFATQLFHAVLQHGILLLSYSELVLLIQKLEVQLSVEFLLLLVFHSLFLQLIPQLVILFESLKKLHATLSRSAVELSTQTFQTSVLDRQIRDLFLEFDECGLRLAHLLQAHLLQTHLLLQ